MSYIIDLLRVPTGKAHGIYKKIIPEALLSHLLKNLVLKNTINPLDIDEILMANAFGTGGNMARYAALLADLPACISSTTIDSQCSGGLKALEIGDALINSGKANLVFIGGLESKTFAPKKYYTKNDPRKSNEEGIYEVAKFFPDQKNEKTMLSAAENVALKHQISKQEMLSWTVDSHTKALICENKFLLEKYISKIDINHRDSGIKESLNIEKLKSLSSENLIDATNSANFNDGAAVVVLASEKYLQEKLTKPLARVLFTESIGINPEFAPEAVLAVIEKLLHKSEKTVAAIDLFEINESFGVIPLVASKYLKIPKEKINILGGNLAYGHPFGASGAINLIHLIASLKAKNLKYGVVAIPAAGGLASAALIENIS